METGEMDTKTEQSFADLDTRNSFTYNICTHPLTTSKLLCDKWPDEHLNYSWQ